MTAKGLSETVVTRISLGFLLARLPVGPDHPDVTAGANFQLPCRASFLLPHRRSAWLRFAERPTSWPTSALASIGRGEKM